MRQKRQNHRGFTAVEVLVSMTLFAIGAAGVIGMQRVSIQGNADARRADIATGIANEWISRLRRDSMMWTEPNSTVNTDNRNTNTLWLKDTELNTLGVAPAPNVGWKRPLVPAAGIIGAANTFDVMGREVIVGSPDKFFCVNYRLDWLTVAPLPQTTIRAEVRVFWPRVEQAPPATCTEVDANVANAQELFHFVYATTTLRRNAT